MTTTHPVKNPARMLLLATLVASVFSVGGCAYGGIATTSDGTILIARNSGLGSLRKIYVCKLVGTAFNCVESTNAP
jgi:hypothetical protein